MHPNGHVRVTLNAKQEICLAGRIDLTNVVAACAEVTQLLQNQQNIRIDLAAIESADSSSLALLIECIRYAKQQHKEITFSNVPPFILGLSRVCGLESILPIDKPLVFH